MSTDEIIKADLMDQIKEASELARKAVLKRAEQEAVSEEIERLNDKKRSLGEEALSLEGKHRDLINNIQSVLYEEI